MIPESQRSSKLRWYYRNHERERARALEWHQRNPEKSKANKRAWRLSNPEKRRLQKRKSYFRNRDRVLAANKAWFSVNRSASNVIKKNYKHRKRAASSVDCKKAIALLHLMPFCQWCFTLLTAKPEIDHVVPLSRGGQHIPENLVASCRSCNASKGSRLVGGFWNQ